MNITVKMPTGKFTEDELGNQILDEEKNPTPILEDKEFEAPFISARKLKRTIIMGKLMEQDTENENTFDRMADYISDIFGRQFSKDNILDGLGSVNLIDEFSNCMSAVTGDLNIKVKKLAETDPNA